MTPEQEKQLKDLENFVNSTIRQCLERLAGHDADLLDAKNRLGVLEATNQHTFYTKQQIEELVERKTQLTQKLVQEELKELSTKLKPPQSETFPTRVRTAHIPQYGEPAKPKNWWSIFKRV